MYGTLLPESPIERLRWSITPRGGYRVSSARLDSLSTRAREPARLGSARLRARAGSFSSRVTTKNSIHVYIQQYNQFLVNFILI
jgi:hypothetical protein